jgi:uncharacterized membrane protein
VARFGAREAFFGVIPSAARMTTTNYRTPGLQAGIWGRAIITSVPTPQRQRPLGLAVFLVISGIIGFLAAWALTLDKFKLLADPAASLGCNINPTVQCGKNLTAWQGAVFGFPNPLMGIAGFVAPILVGVAVIAGARFARWFWMLFNLGIIGAFALVCWFIAQSLLVLGTLCPWCMVVWSVTIPLFWTVTL